MALSDIVNRLFREFKRYTGDGKPGEPVNAPLPVGDPQSGPYNPKKSELRAAFAEIFDGLELIGTDAQEALSDFRTRYLGAFDADPEEDNDGGALIDGALYWNIEARSLRVYDLGSGAWNPASFRPRGAWNGADDYVGGDIVERSGNLWLANRSNTNVEPVEGADWTLFLPGASVANGSITEPKLATGSVSERALQVGVGRPFDTFAQAQGYVPATAPNFIQTAGYTAAGDHGGAVYKKVSAEPAHAGKLSITLSGGGAPVWYEIAEAAVTPQMFGARADCTGTLGSGTDDYAAVMACHAMVRATRGRGVSMRLIGRYRMAQSAVFDFTAAPGIDGGTIRGANANIDGFYFDAGCSITFDASSGGIFFEKLVGFRLVGSINGVFCRIGDDAYAHAWNACEFDLTINNGFQSKTQEVCRMNYVLHCSGKIVCNGGGSGNPLYNLGAAGDLGYGIALRMRQGVMNNLMLGLGNANIGLYLTDGYSNGNLFPAVDIEEVYHGIKIDVSTVDANSFPGGKIVAFNAVNATAGYRNGGSLLPDLYSGGAYLRAGGERFHYEKFGGPFTTPSLPATGGTLVNKTGQRLAFRFEGAITSASLTKANGVAFGMPGVGAGYPLHGTLMPYDTLTVAYTGTPAWQAWPDQ